MSNSKDYDQLIEEVYIDPIRSVLIIDDDYPTWDEFLAPGGTDAEESQRLAGLYAEKKWKIDPAPVRDVISSLRAPHHSLILDVDDGSKIDANSDHPVVSNLHQTDLLILDYQLDRTSQDGTKSIKVLRDITANDHFNLVVVQTAADLDQAFRDILLGLTAECEDDHREDKLAAGLELIDQAEEIDPDVMIRLRSLFAVEQYLALRASPRDALSSCHTGKQPFSAFKELCNAVEWRGVGIRQMLEWAAIDFEVRSVGQMHSKAIPDFKWSQDNTKWIRSSTAFIAFTNKRGRS